MSKPIKTAVQPYIIHELKSNSFVFEIKNALTGDICSEIIKRFEASLELQYPGRVGQTAYEQAAIKKTTDLAASAHETWQDVDQILFRSLALAMRKFRETYPYFNGPFKDMGYNIQRYQSGEYYHWHIDGGSHQFSARQLVAIWYLNDVEGPGGETEFLFQKIKIKPEQGKLILFPPFWTHEHRSVVLQQGLKYIATTWIIFA